MTGSIRLNPVGVVTHTASFPAAVHPAIGREMRATTAPVFGSTRITPSVPVAQIDPNAPTTPVALSSGTCAVSRLVAGSIRTSSSAPQAVTHAAPYAKVASYGVPPTSIAATRLPVRMETRLTVEE